jgi:MFS family permease
MARSESPSVGEISPARGVYHRHFWFAYAANFLLSMANALMFRFAELVAWLGGTEQAVGAIAGTGLFGVLLVRLVLGQGIDRYGTRAMWTLSALLFTVGSAAFLACHEVSWGLYVARTIYSIGVAGAFTCSIVHVQNIVPLERRTEAIGSLGTSGFMGIIAGASLSDGIFASFPFAAYPHGSARFVALCGTAAVLGAIYLVSVVWLTREHLHTPPPNAPAALRLLAYYWPGSVVLVAFTMGMGLSLTTVFLTRFVTERHLPGIRTFFTAYSVIALIFRVPSTQWAKTIGRHKTILIGLAGSTLGHFLLPFVTREWQLMGPALACGFGHAVLYPAIVSLGAGAFPRQYRGLGTTLVLGFIDLGTAVSPPILGRLIDRYGFDRMFFSAAAFGLIVMLYYALIAARKPDSDNDPEPEVFFDGTEPLAIGTPDTTPAN